MRSLTSALTLTALLLLPYASGATEPAAVPTEAPAAAAAAPMPAAPPAPGTAPEGPRFTPPTSRGIQPTVSRLPAYWQCQDNPEVRVVVTYLDTARPSVVLERGGKKVIATLQKSGSGAKYMAPGGILFWERGKEATLQWGNVVATQCASLGG